MAEAFRGTSEPQVAALVARILVSFKALTSTLEDDHARASQATSCMARFKLWAGNLGAHRPSGSRSLEYRLRDASHIRKHVISLLQDLYSSIEQGTALSHSTFVADGGSIPDTTSEGYGSVEDDLADYFKENEDSNKSEVEQILDEIAHVVNCLLRLSATISNPTPHDQFLSRAGDGLVEAYKYWDAQHVRAKFPDVNDDLSNRLGKAMARRRHYFKYREEHKSRLAEGLDLDEAAGAERATTIASSLPEHLKETRQSAEASANRFAMLDDGQSDASGTTYATSSPDSTQLRVPPIPKEHMDGPFECPFCHMIVSIDTKPAWKKHVFRDLRPYVCLSETCQTPDHLYLRRKDWAMHMRREHWKTWHCPFGCPEEFDSAKGFQNHIKVAHKQDVSDEKMATLDALSSLSDMTKARGKCPLCCNFKVKSEKEYDRHVGQHLEHLALFTLPGVGEEGSDDDGDEDEDWLAADQSRSKAAEEQRTAEADDKVTAAAKAVESTHVMIALQQESGGAGEKAAPGEDEVERISPDSRSKAKIATGAEILEDKENPLAATEAEEAAKREIRELRRMVEEERKKAAAAAEAEEVAKKEAKELRQMIEKGKKKDDVPPVRFQDAVGRKFSFPFYLCATWEGMESLIKQAFMQVDILAPHVMEGRYDLIGPDRELITPAVWEKVIQPNYTITMKMWPLDNRHPVEPPAYVRKT